MTKRVIIIGGGFAGCMVAKKLAPYDYDILLFDKRNHHVFQPLLYQVATAMLSPSQIAFPIRSMFKSKKNIRVLIGNILKVDLEQQFIQPKRSKEHFYYDYLVIAAGARHSYFGKKEWEKHAWGLKTIRDALKIRERMLYSFEKAERSKSEKNQRKYSTFVIVGAGPTGVEMAGAIAEVTQKSIADDFTQFDSRKSRIILVEGSDRILNGYPKKLSIRAYNDLIQMGVEVKLNAYVSNITKKGVYFGEEYIETENIIWAAGNIASPLIKNVTSHTNKMGQALVNSDFSIKENPNVFCLGDCAYLKDAKGNIVPAVAQGAMQSGEFVANQIIADSKGKKRKHFTYFNKGTMATIGRSKAVANISGYKFGGFFAWLLWGIVHILFLVDFRNKVYVFFDWITSYFTHKRSARLINTYRPNKK